MQSNNRELSYTRRLQYLLSIHFVKFHCHVTACVMLKQVFLGCIFPPDICILSLLCLFGLIVLVGALFLPRFKQKDFVTNDI